MKALELDGIGRRFGDRDALADVSLTVEPGEILGVTGPSGAGKSTLCRIVSGVERPSRGEVRIAGAAVTRVPPERRRVAVMFESYALYPHWSLWDNVAFPLRAPGAPKLDARAVTLRVRDWLTFVELVDLERRRPAELSGGQRQRVALCRALAQDALAYVLDEPISHLDAKLRHTLRGGIRRRQIRRDAPTIWTSPDALEVLAVADRIAVLVDGRLRQVGAPAEVYRRPADLDVARLVGDPPLNLLAGDVVEDAAGLSFRHPALSLPLGASARARVAPLRGTRVVLGLRPAEIRAASSIAPRGRDGAPGPDGVQPLTPATVWVWEPLGRYGILSVRVGADLVRATVPRGPRFDPGDAVALDLTGAEPLLFDPDTRRLL